MRYAIGNIEKATERLEVSRLEKLVQTLACPRSSSRSAMRLSCRSPTPPARAASSSDPPQDSDTLCWYHHKFGSQASPPAHGSQTHRPHTIGDECRWPLEGALPQWPKRPLWAMTLLARSASFSNPVPSAVDARTILTLGGRRCKKSSWSS